MKIFGLIKSLVTKTKSANADINQYVQYANGTKQNLESHHLQMLANEAQKNKVFVNINSCNEDIVALSIKNCEQQYSTVVVKFFKDETKKHPLIKKVMDTFCEATTNIENKKTKI